MLMPCATYKAGLMLSSIAYRSLKIAYGQWTAWLAAMQAKGSNMNYEQAMYDDYIASLDALPVDYKAEYAQWLEYNDCIQCGFYNRQHALAVYGNAENGVIYYCTDDLATIALGYVYE